MPLPDGHSHALHDLAQDLLGSCHRDAHMAAASCAKVRPGPKRQATSFQEKVHGLFRQIERPAVEPGQVATLRRTHPDRWEVLGQLLPKEVAVAVDHLEQVVKPWATVPISRNAGDNAEVAGAG